MPARRKLAHLVVLAFLGSLCYLLIVQAESRKRKAEFSTSQPLIWPSQERGSAVASGDPLAAQSRLRQGHENINPSLGVFSSVFVISLPTRRDRRAVMEQLRLELGIRWTYVDATTADDALVERLDACVRHFRAHIRSPTFQWPSDSDLHELVYHPLYNLSSEWLPSPTSCYPAFSLASLSEPLLSPHPVDTLRTFDVTSGAPVDSVRSSHTGRSPLSFVEPLTCAVQDRTHGVRFKSSLPSYMLLTPPKLACWYSHLAAIRRFAADNTSLTDAALFLEDDVDMERDIHQRLQKVWGALPENWDIVFIGHCWSDESRNPPLQTPQGSDLMHVVTIAIHPSFGPKCTHAYALSRAGARRILLHLLYSPFSYSRALDQAFAWLVQSGRLRAFSLVPSAVIQHKMYSSDIDGGRDGRGSVWKDRLEHGIIAGPQLSR